MFLVWLQDFCRTKGFQDGELVTEQKLVWFLNDCVLHRPAKKSRHSQDRTDEKGEPVVQTLGHSSVKAYKSAIVNLWSYQQSCRMNPHPHPVGQAVRALIETHARREDERRKTEFLDRGAGTLLDSYNEKDIVRIVEYCWQRWSESKRSQSVEPHLRTAVDFLMGHNMLLRGESRRMTQLADLFTVELTNEGPTPCFPMVLIMGNGKTNQMGWIEYAAVVRHRSPLLCTMGQVAFYLFHQWNVAGEPLPQFHRREEWYALHLIKGEDAHNPISYETQLDWINRVYSGTGLAALKKTHAGRANGARHAELAGVDESQIRRAGRWSNDALSQCYLTNIPRKFVRAMAGFDSRTVGNFYLPRAKVAPPRSLEQAVWPWVDDWLQWFESYNIRDPNSCFEEPELRQLGELGIQNQLRRKPGVRLDRDDLAAQGLLRLLGQLRTILLQDSAILQPLFPGHPLWSNPVFMREDYRQFAEAVRLANMQTEAPYKMRLRQTVPMVADQLRIVRQDVGASTDRLSTTVQKGLQDIKNQLEDLVSGKVGFIVRAVPPAQEAAAAAAATPPERDHDLSLVDAVPVTAGSSSGSSEKRRDNADRDRQRDMGPAPAGMANMPAYQLSRTISTVPDLWREWTAGLGGGPSVQSLDASYGAKWQPTGTERMFYCRRKVIIDAINTRKRKRASSNAAVEELELVRQRGQLSLNGLSKLLKTTAEPS